MLKGQLGYLAERQKLIAQNVANADTPGFTPTDLKPFNVRRPRASGPAAPLPMMAPARTDAGHIAGQGRPVKGGGAAGFRAEATRPTPRPRSTATAWCSRNR